MIDRLTGLLNRRLIVALGMLIAIALALWWWSGGRAAETAKAENRLLLMSSIPIQWGEVGIGELAKGQTEPSALFLKLSETNTVRVIDDFQQLATPRSAPLLLIQPRALAPRELVQLDSWIRGGGSAIIFADPALDWPSELPLGDPRRPLFTSLLSPMFLHWGLELALPVSEGATETEAEIGDYRLAPKSAGIWTVAKGKPSARCQIREDEFIAYCNVGKGRAMLIADADFLYEDRWTDGILAGGTTAWLQELIAAMRSDKAVPTRLWESGGK